MVKFDVDSSLGPVSIIAFRLGLADLVRRRGERPLNLRVGPGQAVRIVLADPAGAWARGAPRIEVALGW